MMIESDDKKELDQRRIDLAALLSEATDLLQVCQKCKMCLSVCPLYTRWYTEGPIGRILAIYYHLKYDIGSREELSKLLFTCTTCRKCQTLCKEMAMGVDTTDLIVMARQILVETINVGDPADGKKSE